MESLKSPLPHFSVLSPAASPLPHVFNLSPPSSMKSIVIFLRGGLISICLFFINVVFRMVLAWTLKSNFTFFFYWTCVWILVVMVIGVWFCGFWIVGINSLVFIFGLDF